MPEAVERCVEDNMKNPKRVAYYNKLKKQGKTKAPNARSFFWAVCTKSYQKTHGKGGASENAGENDTNGS